MDALQLQTRCQCLSAADDEIQRALGGLDERLREWLGVLQTLGAEREAGERLKRLVAPPAPPAPPAEPAALATPAVAPSERNAQANESGGAPDSGPGPEPSAADDEALLASLSPELAKAIRVKRRLSRDRRSIRELLAEMGASPPEPAASDPQAPPRKTWWRKRDE